MASNTQLEDFFNKNQFNIKQLNQKSQAWFTRQANSLNGVVTAESVMNLNLLGGKQKNNVQPGKMYCYFYDPKGKATLPFYDTFPMVLPFSADKTGFHGINMHYLPYKLRFKLLDSLLSISQSKALTPNAKIQMSWKLVGSLGTSALAKFATKQYLFSHVRSQFVEIPADKWSLALMMPVESFKKQNKNTVWRSL